MKDPNCPKFLESHVQKLKEAWEDTNEKAQKRKKELTGKNYELCYIQIRGISLIKLMLSLSDIRIYSQFQIICPPGRHSMSKLKSLIDNWISLMRSLLLSRRCLTLAKIFQLMRPTRRLGQLSVLLLKVYSILSMKQIIPSNVSNDSLVYPPKFRFQIFNDYKKYCCIFVVCCCCYF